LCSTRAASFLDRPNKKLALREDTTVIPQE
jgi:hypothetical protein